MKGFKARSGKLTTPFSKGLSVRTQNHVRCAISFCCTLRSCDFPFHHYYTSYASALNVRNAILVAIISPSSTVVKPGTSTRYTVRLLHRRRRYTVYAKMKPYVLEFGPIIYLLQPPRNTSSTKSPARIIPSWPHRFEQACASEPLYSTLCMMRGSFQILLLRS